MTTLSELCDRHAPKSIDFLKVDVEGAEQDVLFNGNWHKHRPKIVLAEALAPYTLEPVWEDWEPFLRQHGYRYAWFDSLNRYYVAEEAVELAHAFDPPPSTQTVVQYRNTKPALADEGHPDHRLARLLAGADMVELPVLGGDVLSKMLSAEIPAVTLERPADRAAIAHAIERVFGPNPALRPEDLPLACASCVADVYVAITQTDQFCAACGRISASYGW